jgi:hypothetical protein
VVDRFFRIVYNSVNFIFIIMKNVFNAFVLVLICLSTVTISNMLKTNSKATGISYDVSALHGFKCVDLTGIQTPIRLNENGDIECFSTNARDCAWGITTLDQCKQTIADNIENLKPLVCGAPHQAIYSITGYDDPDHWCSQGRVYYHSKWHCKNVTGYAIGMRVNLKTRNIECLSTDGVNCIWNDLNACKNPPIGVKPLQCGRIHAQYYGTDGYHYPTDHWCKGGNAFFFATGEWTCGGDKGISDIPFRLNIKSGDMECFSTNGKDCAWGNGTSPACETYMADNAADLKPLTCGPMHNSIYGGPGYGTANHWCDITYNWWMDQTKVNWH